MDNSQAAALATVELDTVHVAETLGSVAHSSPRATPTREALAVPLDEQVPVTSPVPLAATPQRAGSGSVSQKATPLQAATVYITAARPTTAPPSPVVESVHSDDESSDNTVATVSNPPAPSQSEPVTCGTAPLPPSPGAASIDVPECVPVVPAEVASPRAEPAVSEPAVPVQTEAHASAIPLVDHHPQPQLQLPAIVKPATAENATITLPAPTALHSFAMPAATTRGAVHKPKPCLLCIRKNPEARARLLAQADEIDARRQERARESTRHKVCLLLQC